MNIGCFHLFIFKTFGFSRLLDFPGPDVSMDGVEEFEWVPSFLVQECPLQLVQWNTVPLMTSLLEDGEEDCWEFSMEKAMAPHSSTLAWKIPWTEEPDGLQSMGSLRVGHDWATSLSLFTFMHWRRKWQPTPVFLPGGSQGQGSLVGCRLWGRTESDTTEVI